MQKNKLKSYFKENKKLQVSLIITGFLIGLLLAAQFKTKVPKASQSPYEQLETQQELIKNYQDEQAGLKSKIVSLRADIDKIQAEMKKKNNFNELQYLDALKMELGLTEIQGAGVEILLDDSEGAKRKELDINNDALIHAADLRDVINLLRTINITAISINDQRIIISTPINCVGNSILVNSFNMLPPFTIKVVANPQNVIQYLSDENYLKDIYRRLKEQNIKFAFKQSGNLIIPIFNGNYKAKFLSTAK